MKDDDNLFDQQTAWDSLPRRKVRKHKVDPEKRQIMTWHRFNQKFEHLSFQNRRAKWNTLPRRKKLACSEISTGRH